MSELLLDAAGRRRSPATLPEFHAGRPPRNKGLRYPADPPTIEEIVTVVRRAGGGVHGRRLRGLIVVLWRAGLRICEALALAERAAAAAHGRPRVAPLTTQNSGPTGSSTRASSRGSSCSHAQSSMPTSRRRPPLPRSTSSDPRRASRSASEPRRVAREAGVRRCFAPHQLRHAHAVEMAREGVPLIVIQRQLGQPTHLGITSIYLQGIDNTEIIDTVHARRAPMVPVDSSLRL